MGRASRFPPPSHDERERSVNSPLTTLGVHRDEREQSPQVLAGLSDNQPPGQPHKLLDSSTLPCPLLGYFQAGGTAGAGPGSVEVPGGTLSFRLPTVVACGSLLACVLAGHRARLWLKRGLPSSK